MSRKRHRSEQIIVKLREANVLLSQGATSWSAAVCWASSLACFALSTSAATQSLARSYEGAADAFVAFLAVGLDDAAPTPLPSLASLGTMACAEFRTHAGNSRTHHHKQREALRRYCLQRRYA